MENEIDLSTEPQALSPEEDVTPLPDHIEIVKEQRARLYMDGYEVVANGNVLMAHGSVVAIEPFPKSKTGLTIEFRFATSDPPKKAYSAVRTYDPATDTYRHTFLDYPEMAFPPARLGMYRGKNVMGMLYGKIVLERPRIWSLDYTLYFAPKATKTPS
jgi:hypothetical protein